MSAPSIALAPSRSAPRWLTLLLLTLLAAAALALGLLAGREPLIAVGLGGFAFCAVAIFIKPDVATIVVAAVLYSNAAAVAVNFHGLPYAFGAAFPVLLVAPLAYHVLVRREPLVITPALPWLLAFLGANVLSTLFASDTQPALTELAALSAEGVALYLLLTNVVRTRELLRLLTWVIVLTGACLAFLSVWQEVTRTYGSNYFGFSQVSLANDGLGATGGGTGTKRIGGPFEGGGENRYAQVLVVLVPLALALLFTERRRPLRLLAAASTVLIGFAVVLTYSRGAAVALVSLAVLAALLRFIRFRHLALMAVGVALALTLVPSYAVRVASIGSVTTLFGVGSRESEPDTSIRSRTTENLAGLLIFADHPAIGVGPGLYPDYYERYADRVGDYANQIDIKFKYTNRQAHSLYLGLLAELGVVGFLAFMGVVVVTARSLWRARRRCAGSHPELATLATGYLLGIVAYLITGVFLHLAYQRYFWLTMALAAVAGQVALRTAAAEREPGTAERPERLVSLPARGR